jgi:hypothetical protein
MESVLAVIGLFILRLGVPVVVMVLLAWAVNWYARREEMRALEAEQREAAALAVATPAPEKCYEIKGCSEAAKADCAAMRRPELPCWLAKQLSTGRLSPTCQNCAIYRQSAAVVVTVRA